MPGPRVPRLPPRGPLLVPPRSPQPVLPVERAIPAPQPTDSKEEARRIVAQILEQERERARSAYATGMHIAALLEMREAVGAKNIKELCSKVDLGMSHMTANKYLQVARNFSEDTAVTHGIEKCYALTLYAKAMGRPGQAARILRRNEVVELAEGQRVSQLSASKLYRVVRAIKAAAKAEREPTEIQAARKATAERAEKWARKLGFTRAQTAIVHRGGETRVAIYISLEVAEALEERVLGAVAKLGPTMIKKQPELFDAFRAAGWKLTG